MRVCVAFTCETYACVLMAKGEKEGERLISILRQGLTFTSGNINQVAGDNRRGQVSPCSWKL